MGATGINAGAIAVLGTGGLLVWSGIRGANVTASLRDLLTGQAPSSTNANPITLETGSPGSTGSASGGVVANTGLAGLAAQGVGHAYRFGGAPGRSGANPWDCSSCMNWTVGHLGGRAIPGYGPAKYDGSVHGPATGQWLIWSGCSTVPANQAQPGDLVVWATHMGMYLGSGQMLSALDAAEGTKITTVADGAPGGEGSGTYRRLR